MKLTRLMGSVVLAACGFLPSVGGFAHAQDATPPFPPGLQLQVQPGGGPIIIGPGGIITSPGLADSEPAASAAFEPSVARVGRPVEYRVTITGSRGALELPDPLAGPPGLELSPGGRSVSTQVMNGALVMSTTFRYSAIPGHTGQFTMPGFEVAVGAKRVRVPPVVLTATEAQPGETAYQPVQAELEIPQRDVFVGETIQARILVLETPDESPQYVAHVAKSVGSVVFRPSMRTMREMIPRGGRQIGALVMPLQITPILEGETEIGCQIIVHVQKLDPLSRRGGFMAQSTIDTKPARVRVLALPRAGSLPGFTGAIGQFAISQPKLSVREVEVGEPVTLSLSMTGEGNLEGVSAPDVETGAGWQAYKPTTEYQPDPTGQFASRGTKSFTYTLVPGRAGQRSTPAIPFCYFDPVRRAYVDVTIPPVPIVVKESSAPPPATGPEPVKPETLAPTESPHTVEPAMTGIEERPGRFTGSLGPVVKLRWFLMLQCGPPAVLLALWAWRSRREYLARNPQILRRRRARVAARRALAAARVAARKGDHDGFLSAGLGALREAAAPLDTAQAGSLTREEVLRVLRDDEATSAMARKVLESADAAKYSTKTGNGFEPSALLPELERAVRNLVRRV